MDTSLKFDLPFTSTQLSMWFSMYLDPGNHLNVSEYLEIHGSVDSIAFEAALLHTLYEAETLRVNFVEVEVGQPMQRVEPINDWRLLHVDFCEQLDPRASAKEWMHKQSNIPIDRNDEKLFRFALLHIDPDCFYWYMNVHHAVLDGFGFALIARRVAHVYSAFVNGTLPDSNPFGSLSELVDEDVAYRASGQYEADREYWLARMGNRPEPTCLTRRRLTAARNPLRRTIAVDVATTQALRDKARVAKVAWPVVMMATVALYLQRMTGQSDLMIGMPVTGRVGRIPRSTPAAMVNVVPLRLDVKPNTSLAELLRHVSTRMREGLRHQRYPYQDLRRELKLLDRDGQLLRTYVNVETFEYDLCFAEHPTSAHVLANGAVGDLCLFVFDRGDGRGLQICGEADAALYSLDEVALHQRRLVQVLKQLVTMDLDRPLCQIELLDPVEHRQVVEHWNPAARPVPELTLSELFEAQVKRDPHQVALVWGGAARTYRQINVRANRLAHLLLTHGVAPEHIVAVLLPHSADFLVAILAVLKAGAAYLPIDIDYPTERVEFMLADAQPTVVLSADDLSNEILDGYPDTDPTDADRLGLLTLDHPAYVIYTSGSTGKPKGVIIPHRGIVNLFHSHRRDFFETEVRASGRRRFRAAMTAAFTFDTSWDAILWMFAGYELHLIEDGTRRDADALAAYVAQERIDFLDITPTYASHLLKAGLFDEGRHHPEVLMLGGEKLDASLWAKLRRVPTTRIYNFYGLTECTVDSLYTRIDDHEKPVLGRPVWNTRAYVLDNFLCPLPPGALGELYLAGDGLARGYLNRPALTAERFVACPFGGRMYRTGDIVCWTSDGQLEFLGRIDDQITLRGFRIEPGEIETTLAQHPSVSHAVVIARHERLVAYIVTHATAPDTAELRKYLSISLPDHMVPAAFVVLDRLPTTPHGKVDRAALPNPDSTATTPTERHPSTHSEQLLCELFAEVLDLPRIETHDNFFDLGGHSLLAARLIDRVRSMFDVKIDIRALFEAPTVAMLAQRLDENANHSTLDVLLPLRRHGSGPALFCFHPAAGICTVYSSLLPHVNRHPVYGLQARGLDGLGPLASSIDAMVEDYLTQIRAVQPTGPYHLLGWSFGGVVAHTVAIRLQQQNERVGLLAVLDVYPLRDYTDPLCGLSEQEIFANMLVSLGYDPTDFTGTPFEGLDSEQVSSLVRVLVNNVRLTDTYTPGVFEGDMLFFTATLDKANTVFTPEMWYPYVTGQIDVHPIASDHGGMTQPEPMAEIGPRVAAMMHMPYGVST